MLFRAANASCAVVAANDVLLLFAIYVEQNLKTEAKVFSLILRNNYDPDHADVLTYVCLISAL